MGFKKWSECFILACRGGFGHVACAMYTYVVFKKKHYLQRATLTRGLVDIYAVIIEWMCELCYEVGCMSL